MYVNICVPSTGTWLSETGQSIVKVYASYLVDDKTFGSPRTIRVSSFDGCNLSQNRSGLVDMSLEQDCSHILFLDADMTYPEDTIARLYKHNKFIVAANYPKRDFPIVGTAVDFNWDPVTTTKEDTGLAEVQFAPTGCMLIKTEVFKSIEKPWFAHSYVLELQKYATEDVYFCNKAREAGYSVWIDHDLSKEIEHVGKYKYKFLKEKENGLE